MMKPLYLLYCLLSCSFLSSAQKRTEISDWVPKHNLTSKLKKVATTLTLWNDTLPAEVREYYGPALQKLTLYNSAGLPVEMQHYIDADTPRLSNRIVYAYNDAGQKTTETELWGNDTLVPLGVPRVRNYSYNRRGQLEKITYSYIYKGGKQVDVSEQYSYDENDSLLRKTYQERYSHYTAVWQYEYSTDEHNHRKVKEFFTNKRKLRLSKSYTYDAAGRLIREYEKNRGGNGYIVRTYEYTLDARGDWTTKRFLNNHRYLNAGWYWNPGKPYWNSLFGIE